jgi:hypothetical protein
MLCMDVVFRDVFQVRNQIVKKWIAQRNSSILFWRFRGMISLVVCLPSRLDIPSDVSKDLAKLSADSYNSY